MAGEFLRDKMKILANRDIKQLFCRIAGICLFFWLLTEGIVWHVCHQIRLIGGIAVLFALMFGLIAETCWTYFSRQNRLMEEAAAKVQAFLDGDTDVRIACDEEGEIYRLFHVVNTLAAGLNAQLSKKNQEKEFLKDTISDISHQLKTPLAALNIYNGLMQDGTENMADIQTFVALSEKELDRMEMLVQNLLKITKLDVGSIVFERHMESVSEMMEESREHFRYRAKQEQKHLIYSGDEDVRLLCDRSWLMEMPWTIPKRKTLSVSHGSSFRRLSRLGSWIMGAVSIRRICIIYSSGFIAAVFQKTPRDSDLVCLWQSLLSKPMAVPSK